VEAEIKREHHTSGTALFQTLNIKLGESSFCLGPAQRYISAEIKPSNLNELNGNLPSEWEEELTSLLTLDVTISGLGISLEYDSRDNIFSPESGLKYEFNYILYDDVIGSDVNYNLTEFSGLHYLRLAKQWRTAFRAEVNYADSDSLLPPFATPSISMRGIPSGRYQGKAIALSEIEVIYEINSRWEVNAFVGIGKASNEFSYLTDSSSRVSRGVGFRYLVARRYGFNVGIDTAEGPEDNVLYIQAGSAW